MEVIWSPIALVSGAPAKVYAQAETDLSFLLQHKNKKNTNYGTDILEGVKVCWILGPSLKINERGFRMQTGENK